MSGRDQADPAGATDVAENVHPMPGVAQPAHEESDRNPGTGFEPDWVEDIRVNLSAAERRAATLVTRRTVKKDWQAAWLLKAISCIDLTTLSGDDTPGKVRRLCAKARRPVRAELLEALGAGGLDLTVGAVCVYHALVETAATGMPLPSSASTAVSISP